jgi:hypothetical protein
MMKGAGSVDYDEIKRLNDKRDAKRVRETMHRLVPDATEGYQDWHSLVGDDDLEDNPNT